jgi:hypothetical protein
MVFFRDGSVFGRVVGDVGGRIRLLIGCVLCAISSVWYGDKGIGVVRCLLRR